MIDTDKYEGHTPAPWRVVKPTHANATGHIWCIESATEIDYSPDHYTRVAHICVIHNEDDDTINAALIADAPLLLEEVKRLRDLCDGLYTYANSIEHESIIESFDGSPLTLAHFQKEMTWVNWRAKEWIEALDSIAEKMNGDEEE